MRTHLKGPKLSGHVTHISMMAGKASPNADKQNAPNSDINKPSRGMLMARTTATKILFNFQEIFA